MRKPRFLKLSECDYIGKPVVDSKVITSNYFDNSRFDSPREFLSIPDTPPDEEYDVVIVGGGLSGLMTFFHVKKLFPKFKVAIIDERNYLASNFIERTTRINQRVLRSTYDHHLAPDGFFTLLDFAKLHYKKLTKHEVSQLASATRGERSIVPLDLFISHIVYLVRAFSTPKNSFRREVTSIKKSDAGFISETSLGEIIKSKYIYLCCGIKNNVSDCTPSYQNINSVVGSGMTAAAVLIDKYMKNEVVTWFHPDTVPYRCSDVKLHYFRGSELRLFKDLPLKRKLSTNSTERKSSITPEYVVLLENAINEGFVMCKPISHFQKRFTENVFISKGYSPAKLPLNNFISTIEKYSKSAIYEYKDSRIFILGAITSLVYGPGAWNIEGIRIALQESLVELCKIENCRFVNNFTGTSAIG